MTPLADDRFAELFRLHYPRLVGLARRVLGDANEAEDAAQEALLALRVDPVAERSDPDIAAWSLDQRSGRGGYSRDPGAAR